MSTEQTLAFGKKPVRIVMDAAEVWFAAMDLYEAKNRHTNKKHLACFDRSHLRLHTFRSEAGAQRLTLVSTLGALTVASGLPRPEDAIMDAWIRKQVVALGFARPPLALGADGAMPARPKATWLAYEDWEALSAAHPNAQRNPPVDNVAELDDDDLPLSPFKPSPERIAADAEAMLAAEFEVVTIPRRATRSNRRKR